jgi:hypothetical protein
VDKHAKIRLRDVKMLTQYLLPFLRTRSIAGMEEQKVITGLLDLLLQIMPYPAY